MCLPTNYARKIIQTFILNQQPTPVLNICSKKEIPDHHLIKLRGHIKQLKGNLKKMYGSIK